MKKLSILFVILALLFGYTFKYTIQKQRVPINIDAELKKTATKEYLNTHIKYALKSDKIDDAKEYVNLAKYLKVDINSSLLKELKKKDNYIDNTIRESKDFINGFLTGKAESGASLGGSIVSDFTLYGDLRDIYKEGKKYILNENYDKFLLGVSMVGVALTASTYVSLGATSPVKSGESAIKVAYKSGKITKGFTKVIEGKLAKSVDLKALKKADFSSFTKAKNSIKQVAKTVNTKPLKSLFKSLNKIEKSTSFADTVKLLKYVDNEKDLAKLTKITAKYKKNSVAVLKVLGKRVLRGTKLAIKYGTKFFINLFAFIFSIFGFFVSLFLARRVKRVFV